MVLKYGMVCFTLFALVMVTPEMAISSYMDGQPEGELRIRNNLGDSNLVDQDMNVEFDEDRGTMRIHYTMDQLAIGSVYMDDDHYSILDIGSDSITGEVGRPMLPSITYLVAVPDIDAEIKIVPVRSEIMGINPILPLQNASPDVYPQSDQDIIFDDDYYRSPGPYPERIIEISTRGNIGDIPFIRIDLTPVTILNDEWEIEIIRECTIEITWKDTGRSIDIESGDPMINSYSRIFCDWNGFLDRYVDLRSSALPTENGGCEYLVITEPDFMDASLELATWKNQMGILTRVYDTDQIGNTAAEIGDFIQNAYDTWTPRPTYVLFMGDVEFIPTNYMYPHSYHGMLLGTDHWYSTVNGTDYYSDIFVGRMPVNDPDEAMMVVNKTIKYERDPPDHQEFYENITLAAYFQDRNYDGYADRRFAQTTEETMAFIESLGYTGERIYCTSSSVTPTYWNQGTYSNGEAIPSHLLRSSGFAWDGDAADIDAAIEEGSFLVTHRDHGASWGWGDPRYTTSNIPNLDNGDLLPVVFSINCLTGMMDHETANDTYWGSAESFSERFLTQEGGGAVGVIGATRVSYSGYNDYFYKGLYDAIYPSHTPALGNSSGMYKMGEVLAYGKYYMANTWGNPWGIEQLEFELFQYFGDPTMEIWTAEPADLNVTHPSTITHGSTMVRINTSEDGVLVCISQNGRIVGRNQSLNGHVNITTPPLFNGTYDITATDHDFRPYLGSFNITTSSMDLCIIDMAGPLSGEAGVNWTCTAVVMNTGGLTATGVNVTLKLDGIEVNRTSLTILPTHGMIPVSLNWTPECDGWHELSLHVESPAQETSVYDNEIDMKIRIFGEPSMEFDLIDCMEFWVRTGEITDVNFTIGNSGLGSLVHSIDSDILFHEDFNGGGLIGSKWKSTSHGLGTVDYALNVPSGPSCLEITDREFLDSNMVNLSGYENLTISFMLRRGGFHYTCESYDKLEVYYINDNLQVDLAYSTSGPGLMEGLFYPVTIDLPADASHDMFAFRLQIESYGDSYSDGPGRFYIDDIMIRHDTGDHFIEVLNGTDSIEFDQETQFTIEVNGTSLSPGYHNTSLYMITNDPDMGSFPVNVSVEIRENITPEADAGSDMIINQHETVTLNASNSSDNTGIINWTWKVADHDTDVFYFEEISSHTFHEAGTFTAELSVNDYALNFGWDAFNITVLDTTDPFASAGTDITLDQHETMIFNGSGSSDNVGITEYRWRFTDVTTDIVLDGLTTSYAFHEAGEFIVNLTVTDAMGNEDHDLLTVIVNDITIPDIDAGMDLIVDQHEIFTLSGTLCTDNVCIVNWTWSIDIGEVTDVLYGMIVEYSIHHAGEYTFLLNASDGAGNFDTDDLDISVRDITSPIVITQGDVIIDQFSSLNLNGTGSSDNVMISNYTWIIQMEDVDRVLYGPDPSMTFDKAGVYNATLHAWDLSFNTANSSFTITVQDREKPVIITATELSIDQHQDLKLNASASTDNVGIVNFTWVVHLDPDVVTLHGANNMIRIDDAGPYTVDINLSDEMGNWAATTISITVHDVTPPIPHAYVESQVYAGNITVFNASGSEDNVGIDHYGWSFLYDDDEVILEGQEIEFTFEIPGTYNVTLTIRDAVGNEEEETYTIIILPTDGDDDTVDDDGPGDDDPGDFPWIYVVGAIASVVIILIIILALLILLLRNKEDEEIWEE